MKKALKITAFLLLTLIVLTPTVCLFTNTPFFTFGIGGDRVDRIDGFYVALYTEEVYTTTDEEGKTSLHFIGGDEDVTEYGWKHVELTGLTAYKRYFCFSKKTDYEKYDLMSEDGEYCYGALFVLRSPNGIIHYYYRRIGVFTPSRHLSEIIFSETVSFSYDGGDLPLTDYTRFSTRVDFTTGDKILSVNGRPCLLSPR